jgi:hypothetical protein
MNHDEHSNDSTDTLTLTHSQMLDPAALQQALAQHGIPALVKIGTYCWSNPRRPIRAASARVASGYCPSGRPSGCSTEPPCGCPVT